MSLDSTATSRLARTQRASRADHRHHRPPGSSFTAFGGLLLLVAASAGMTGSMPMARLPSAMAAAPAPGTALAPTASVAAAAQVVAQVQPAPVIAFKVPARVLLSFDNGYYDQLRARMNWEQVKLGDQTLRTPDPVSRVLLTQAAARKAQLDKVGLDWRDVYGIINAETSWIPRLGASKDGTPNLGIAQFEPATARALGLRNPEDPVESVHVMALHLKDAAEWSARRLSGLKLSPAQYALKLREGLSIYYNLSSKGRAMWNGENTAKLPIETQRHIANARRGAEQAAELASQLASVRARTQMPGTMTASLRNSGS